MKLAFAAVAAAMVASAGLARAGTFTDVNLGSSFATRGNIAGGINSSAGHLPSTEGGTNNSLANIMARMYMGTSNLTNVSGDIEGTLTFGNTGVTAVRVFDGGAGGPLHLGLGGAGKQDQLWRDGVVTFETKARYAGYAQNFGYRVGATPGGFEGGTAVLDVSQQGFQDNGPFATLTIGSPTDFQWMRANSSNGLTNPQYSLDGNNHQGRDQMVTWEIFGFADGKRRYVIGFEDINQGFNPDDRDFNDLVVEITVDNIVPLPTAGGMALAGLGALALRRRRA
jgi:hypothetical protein